MPVGYEHNALKPKLSSFLWGASEMKTFALFAICIMICSGCMSTCPDTNRVSFVNSNTAGFVLSQNYNVDLIAKAALGNVQEEVNNVESVDIVGWSLKSDNLNIPPRLFEEVLVCIKWLDKHDARRWSLSHVARFSNSTGSADRQWQLSPTDPPLIASRMCTKRPDMNDITSFIRATNFGYNEFDADREVVKVISYHKSTDIIQALSVGLSEKEKVERNADYLKTVAPPGSDL